jgi:FixJ family two-component response regulator
MWYGVGDIERSLKQGKVTDLVMPGMDGRDLAQNLLSLLPDLRCLFMSGYSADVVAHHGGLDEGVQFIPKPFSIQDLTIKVRAALDRRSHKGS